MDNLEFYTPTSFLICKLFQLNLKHRHSGMDCRNLGSMDGGIWGHPCNLDSGNPCRNDVIAETSS